MPVSFAIAWHQHRPDARAMRKLVAASPPSTTTTASPPGDVELAPPHGSERV